MSEQFVERRKIHSNESEDLCFMEQQKFKLTSASSNKMEKESHVFSGMLYRSFTELDLIELRAIDRKVKFGL